MGLRRRAWRMLTGLNARILVATKVARIKRFIIEHELPNYTVDELWNVELDADLLKWRHARNLPARGR